MATVPQKKQVPVAGEWSDEVLEFCRKHGVEADVKLAVKVAEKFFNPGTCYLEVEGDPESENQWLAIQFDARGPVEGVLDAYSRCKKEWIALASQQGRFLIRFAYNIV